MRANRRIHYILNVFFVLVLVLSLHSCKENPLGPDPLVDVPTTFNIRLIEQLDTTGSTFSFEVSTLEFQDCIGKTIDYNLSESYSALLVSLNDIITPDECPDGSAPAMTTIPFSNMENRTYSIDINLKNTVKNSGFLHVLPDRYILEMDSENGFQVLSEEVLRVPENAVWGSFAYRSENMSDLAQDFLNQLNDYCVFEPFETGDYGYFYVVSDQNVLIPDQSPQDLPFRRNFLVSCTADHQQLSALLEDFRTTYGTDIHIQLTDFQGIEY